ncbi:fibronectin type III domain-containing protein [Micromonospora sp. NPDC048169]|uniref:fibronectin type III domain-containing protein n=1 Tax=Micromonospora sp. NPDC048169 TaxID=3154711 RepID=UPI003400B161
MSAAELNGMWTAYGNAGGHWTGGDRTVSVPLPDGRVAWFFSDTFLGTVNSDGSRPANSPMVHNTLVVQDESGLTETRHGGTAAAPKSFMCDDSVGLGCWVADAVVDGSVVRVLVNKYAATGPGVLDVKPTGNALVTLTLPGLAVQEVRDLPLGSAITWGQELLNEAGYTYIYGSEHAEGVKFARLARVPLGGLAGPWQFWTGNGWSSQANESARIASGVGTAFAVQKINGQYLLVTMEGHLVFNSTIVAYAANSPTGPFGDPIELARVSPGSNDRPLIVYDTSTHPSLAANGKLLISYNVNSFDRQVTLDDVTTYRPRFIEVDWPRPQPDPSLLPAAPTNIVANADVEGGVHLSWTAPAGSGMKYWVYQKDVTAEQIQWVRLPQSVDQASADLTYLKDGHTYQYRVAAENAVGEGPASAVVSAVASVRPPAAPANLTATARTDGKISLSWGTADRAWHYEVQRRDVTAGQSEFQPVNHPEGTTTSLIVDWLEHQHEYEFRVRGVGGSGPGEYSAPARATAVYSVPSAPAALTASAQSDGTIRLSWTAPPGDVWHSVYQRDVTAGETEFTKWPYPVTEGSTATARYLAHGHEYEYKVVATNRGGESAPSNLARAVASYAAPAAPSGLTASVQADGTIKLAWTASPGEVWYRIYQRNLTAGETVFSAWPAPVAEGTTATAEYVTHGHEYEFKVAATNAGGESAASNTVRVRSLPALPTAPTGLSASAQANGTVVLNWQASGTNVWYAVYQRDVTAGESQFSKWPLPVSEGTTATAQYLAHGHEYEFKIAATNAAGESPATAPVRATARYAAPSAPTNLRGATAGDGKIELNWDAPAPGVYSVIYWRDVTAGQSAFTRLEYLTTQTSITMEYLQHGHVYEYKVAATTAGGEGTASATVRVTAAYNLPSPPTNLVATAGDGKVTLSWAASPTANVNYIVYYRDSAAGQSWQRLAYPVTATSQVVQYLTNGRTYQFQVKASNAGGESAPTATASAKPMPPLPQPPSGLTASPGDGKVSLRWTASPSGNVWYWIEMRNVTAGQAWTRLKSPVDATSITLDYMTNGQTYEFRVRANNVAGDSVAASNVASARPMPPFPQSPSNLTVTAGVGQATLRWTASPTSNVWYYVYRRDVTANKAWERLPYPISSCCTIKIDTLVPNRTYEFKVAATNLSGTSEASNVARVTMPLPPAASDITVRPALFSLNVSWPAVSGADGYAIYYRKRDGANDLWPSRANMTRLPYPVTGTSFTINHLYEPGNWWVEVVAMKYGVEAARNYDAMDFNYTYKTTDDSYLYESVVSYIYSEMYNNARSGVITAIRADVASGVGWNRANVTFAALVAPGQPWDHKPKIERMLGPGLETGSKGLYYRVPGREYEIYYDIWSNIHYGYVGRRGLFPRDWLQYTASKVGITDAGDRYSIALGMDLYDQKGMSLTRADVDGAVRASLPIYFGAGKAIPLVLSNIPNL